MAYEGTGATLTFGTSAWSASITEIDLPERSRGVLDTTHLGTTGSKTYIVEQLVEEGEFSFRYQYDPEVHATEPISGAAETVTITLKSGATISFQGAWTKAGGASVRVGELMIGSATVKVMGAVTVTPAPTPTP